MKTVVKVLAVIGGMEIAKSICTSIIRGNQKLHAGWINRLQANVNLEIDLYENRWTQAEKAKAGNECKDCHKPMRSFCQDCADIP